MTQRHTTHGQWTSFYVFDYHITFVFIALEFFNVPATLIFLFLMSLTWN